MQKQNCLRRREVVARILKDRGDLLVVTGLGSPTYDCAAVGDHPLNFYLWGAMGSALTVGLGLALARPHNRILVLTGDGEMLMGLGALATAGAKQPDNLAVAVIDNERYGETGMQPTHTSAGVDLAGIARCAGFRETLIVRSANDLESAIPVLYKARGPVFVTLKVSAERDPLVLPSWDGPQIKQRFRGAVLGTQIVS
jgi:thiamine pyrophosphate-dependent acetolactate synthase large subunit-like protein